MRTIEVRQDISSTKLRQYAKNEKNARVCKRLLGIAHFLDTSDRLVSEKIACLSNSNFRIWLNRFNGKGIAGLLSKKQTGRPVKLSLSIRENLKEKVVNGPSTTEGLSRYRIVDLQDFLKNEHNITMTKSGIWYTLQNLDLSWKTGRQRHPKSDEVVQDTFKKTSKTNSKP
jgi:transposase